MTMNPGRAQARLKATIALVTPFEALLNGAKIDEKMKRAAFDIKSNDFSSTEEAQIKLREKVLEVLPVEGDSEDVAAAKKTTFDDLSVQILANNELQTKRGEAMSTITKELVDLSVTIEMANNSIKLYMPRLDNQTAAHNRKVKAYPTALASHLRKNRRHKFEDKRSQKDVEEAKLAAQLVNA